MKSRDRAASKERHEDTYSRQYQKAYSSGKHSIRGNNGDGPYLFHSEPLRDKAISDLLGKLVRFGCSISQLRSPLCSSIFGGEFFSEEEVEASCRGFSIVAALENATKARIDLVRVPWLSLSQCVAMDDATSSDRCISDNPLVVNSPENFLGVFQDIRRHLMRIISVSLYAATDQSLKRTEPAWCRCSRHRSFGQQKARIIQHGDQKSSKRQFFQRLLRALARSFKLCCMLRCDSVLFSCFLLYIALAPGHKGDPTLDALASMWILCDDVDVMLKKIDVDGIKEFTSGVNNKDGEKERLRYSGRSRSLSAHFASFGDDTANESNNVTSGIGANESYGGAVGSLKKFMKATTSLIRNGPSDVPQQKENTIKGNSGTPRRVCHFLSITRAQCASYVRGFVASVIPIILWAYLTRVLLPPTALPLSHLLIATIERKVSQRSNEAIEDIFVALRSAQSQFASSTTTNDSFLGLENFLRLVSGCKVVANQWRAKLCLSPSTKCMTGESFDDLYILNPNNHIGVFGSVLAEIGINGDGSLAAKVSSQRERCKQFVDDVFLSAGIESMAAESEKEAARNANNVRDQPTVKEKLSNKQVASSYSYYQRPQTIVSTHNGRFGVGFESVNRLAITSLRCYRHNASVCIAVETSFKGAIEYRMQQLGLEKSNPCGTAENDLMHENPLALPFDLLKGFKTISAIDQIFLTPQEHIHVLVAGLCESIMDPIHFKGLELERLLPHRIDVIAKISGFTENIAKNKYHSRLKSYLSFHGHSGDTKTDDSFDEHIRQVIDDALFPENNMCTIPNDITDCIKQSRPITFSEDAICSMKIAIKRLLTIEVEPEKTGRIRLPVDESLLLEIGSLIGVSANLVNGSSCTRIPAWSMLNGGYAIGKTPWDPRRKNELKQIANIVINHNKILEEELDLYLCQKRVDGDGKGQNAEINDWATSLTDTPSAVRSLSLLAALHQPHHFGCGCCCCFSDSFSACWEVHSGIQAALWMKSTEVLEDEGLQSKGVHESRGRIPINIQPSHASMMLRKSVINHSLIQTISTGSSRSQQDMSVRAHWSFVSLNHFI